MTSLPPENQEKRRMIKPPKAGGASGRGIGHETLRTAKRHTASSQKWLERQINDPFVAKAKQEGWRSRAAFKIMEINERFHLIKRGHKIVDLGCAPGGWVQVALKAGAERVVGIDLLPVDPISGADLLQGDFTEPAMSDALYDLLGQKADCVISDLAHNTVGHKETDHLKIIGLIEIAAQFAFENLKLGGSFVAKAFQGGATHDILNTLKQRFSDVRHFKPKSSRADSSEIYLVCRQFKG